MHPGRGHPRLSCGAPAQSGEGQDPARGRAGSAASDPRVVPAARASLADLAWSLYLSGARAQVRCLRRLRFMLFSRQVVRLREAGIGHKQRGSPHMSVSKGREFLSIPGPTNVPDEVLAAMHRPAIDIYSGEMIGITDSCLADLRSIFRTKGRTYIYAANGHGGWEAALTNVLSRGDLVLALESGRFATGWGEMASTLGVYVEVLKGHWRRAVDPGAVEQR